MEWFRRDAMVDGVNMFVGLGVIKWSVDTSNVIITWQVYIDVIRMSICVVKILAQSPRTLLAAL